MIYDIKKYGEKCLREVAKPVEKIDSEILDILTSLEETMYEANGVGLAAPQVGIDKRLIVIDIGEGTIRKIINPEILELSGEEEMEEGCLSIPGIYKPVIRAKEIKVKYLNEKNEVCEEVMEDLLARAFQHEMDHLEGVLFVDKIQPVAKRMISKKLQNLKKESEKK